MASQLAWVKNIGSDEPPNHHEQSRKADLRRQGRRGQGKGEERTNYGLRITKKSKSFYFRHSLFVIRYFRKDQRLVDHSLESFGPGRQATRTVCEAVARPKIFVGDVQGREDGQADGVAGGGRLGRQGHPRLDKLDQLLDVLRIEFRADRILLPVDLDVNDRHFGHLQVQPVELFEHLSNPALDKVALFAQRHHLGAGAFGAVNPRLERLDLGPQLAVFFGHPRLFALDACDGVDEELDLLFKSIDRFESGGSRLGGHS